MNFLQYPRIEHDYHLTQCSQRYGCCMYAVNLQLYPYGECTNKKCERKEAHAFTNTCYSASPRLLCGSISGHLRPSNEWYVSYEHGLFKMNYIFINKLCQQEMNQIDMLTYRGALRRVWRSPIYIVCMSRPLYTPTPCRYCFTRSKTTYKEDMIATATTIVHNYWKGTPLPFLSSNKMNNILATLPARSAVVLLKKSYVLLKIAYFAQQQILKAYSCRVLYSIVPEDIYKYIISYLIPHDTFHKELKRFHLIHRCLEQAQQPQVYPWRFYSLS